MAGRPVGRGHAGGKTPRSVYSLFFFRFFVRRIIFFFKFIPRYIPYRGDLAGREIKRRPRQPGGERSGSLPGRTVGPVVGSSRRGLV